MYIKHNVHGAGAFQLSITVLGQSRDRAVRGTQAALNSVPQGRPVGGAAGA